MTPLRLPGSWLSGLGWKARIYGFAGLLTGATIAVAAVSGGAIYFLNGSIQDAVGKARERAALASTARLSVIAIDRALARLVAAGSSGNLRREAVAAIRAASSLEESLQNLQQALTDDADVAELVRINQEVTSTRMAIIKAAKDQDSGTALEQMQAIEARIARIEELSEKIFSDEQTLLTERVAETAAVGNRVILLLAIVGLGSAGVAAFLSILFAGQLTASIRDIQRTVGLKSADDVDNDGHALAIHANEVAEVASRISGSEARLTHAVEQIKAEALNVRSATEESSRYLEGAAGQVQNVANSADASATSIGNIVDQFDAMTGEMKNAIGTTQALQKSVSTISDIANAISDISAQTNLLALNAAIEAARAGEHGRGFAVVATEVRNLARRTSQATEQIHEIAHGIDREVGKAVASLDRSALAVGQNSERLNRVLESSTATARATCTARESMDSVMAQMALQREAVHMIEERLADVEATCSETAEQSAALQGVSAGLGSSSRQLADLAEKLKL